MGRQGVSPRPPYGGGGGSPRPPCGTGAFSPRGLRPPGGDLLEKRPPNRLGGAGGPVWAGGVGTLSAPRPKAPGPLAQTPSAAGGSGLWQGLCRPAALPRRPAPRRLSGGGLPNPLPQGSGLFLWPRGLPLIPAGEHPLFQKPGGHVSPFAGDLDRPAGQRLHPAAKQAAALRLHHPGG